MSLTNEKKDLLKKELIDSLRSEEEITRIIVFGSFLKSDNPRDMDVAVFLKSSENYYTLIPRLRSRIRSLLSKIPVDIVPVLEGIKESLFLKEILSGEVIYER